MDVKIKIRLNDELYIKVESRTRYLLMKEGNWRFPIGYFTTLNDAIEEAAIVTLSSVEYTVSVQEYLSAIEDFKYTLAGGDY